MFCFLEQGPRSNFEIRGGTVSDSILEGHKTPFLTHSFSTFLKILGGYVLPPPLLRGPCRRLIYHSFNIFFSTPSVPWASPQVTVNATSYSTIAVQWTPLANIEFAGVAKGYRVFFTNDSTSWNNQTVDASQVELLIIGLQSYTNYSVQVAGISSKGEGVRSLAVNVTTPGNYYLDERRGINYSNQLLLYLLFEVFWTFL